MLFFNILFLIQIKYMKNFSTPIPQNMQTSSLANKYGISMKQNNSLGGLGMNPNLNIEDQYIENLLKQIHFLNLQIKLIKEKQSQSKNNALWGIINRTNEPMVTNIIQSTKKYQVMKKDSDSLLHRLQRDIAGLQNKQEALINELKFLEQKRAEIEFKQKKWQQDIHGKHLMLSQRIKNNEEKLKIIKQQMSKQKIRNKQFCDEEAKFKTQDSIEKAKHDKQSLQIKNDELIQETIERQLIAALALYKLHTASLLKRFQENTEYVKASEQQKVLAQKIVQVQRDISSSNFDILQLNECLKLAQIEKDKQIRERKKLTQQYQQKKVMLSEITCLNGVRKDKETESRRRESVEIAKAEEQRNKLEKNLEEIKKKLLKNQQSNSLICSQVGNYETEIAKCKESQKVLKQQIDKYKKSNEELDSKLVSVSNEMIISSDYYQKALHEQTNVFLQLFGIEKELQYLRGRKQHLNRNIQLKDVLNQLNIEDLQKVVQKNNDLNSTVASLMSKWEQIKTFGRI